MPRKESKVAPEGIGPVRHYDEFGSRELTVADLYRIFEKRLDRMDKHLGRVSEYTGMLRATNQRLYGLEHKARQPCLATETDVKPRHQDLHAYGGCCSRPCESRG